MFYLLFCLFSAFSVERSRGCSGLISVSRVTYLHESEAKIIGEMISDAFDEGPFRIRALGVYNRVEQLKYRLKNLKPHVMFTARSDLDKILGFVELGLSAPPELNGPHVPLIGNLVVQPNARRRGVAKNLMQAAEEEAKSWPDFNMIYCAVKPTNNPAISLYCDKLSYAECQLSPEGDAFLPNGGTIMTHVQEGLIRRNSPRLLLFKRLHP